MGRAVLTPKGMRWFRSGHPWVYRDDLAALDAGDGQVVDVCDPRGGFRARALASTRSKIALRILTRRREAVDDPFWERRIDRAVARRKGLRIRTNALRLVASEADGIPGLVADLYGETLVVASSTAAIDARLEWFAARLAARAGATRIVERSDGAARGLEGLPRRKAILAGEATAATWVFEETPSGRIEYPVDTWEGQKTGAFLDQRENRYAAARWARGRVADLFCYSGLTGLIAAGRAREIIAVDTSGPALARGRLAAERNGIGNARFLRANVFRLLKAWQRAGERFDTIILDPPAFARSRKDVPAARRAYEEINRRALGLLPPGGILISSSCSYNLREEAFLAVLRRAAAGARATVWVLERRGQASDHPVLLALPESRYLKWVALRVESSDDDAT